MKNPTYPKRSSALLIARILFFSAVGAYLLSMGYGLQVLAVSVAVTPMSMAQRITKGMEQRSIREDGSMLPIGLQGARGDSLGRFRCHARQLTLTVPYIRINPRDWRGRKANVITYPAELTRWWGSTPHTVSRLE